jgi:hypothetical protein
VFLTAIDIALGFFENGFSDNDLVIEDQSYFLWSDQISTDQGFVGGAAQTHHHPHFSHRAAPKC